MKRVLLPASVLVLDVETSEFVVDCPEQCKVAIVGTTTYSRSGGRYSRGSYRVWEANQIESLLKFLASFPGVIVGHNIFAFDYRVIARNENGVLHLPKGVIEKSVDTLAVLLESPTVAKWIGGPMAFVCGSTQEWVADNQQYAGLGLDNLCRKNIGRGKRGKASSVGDLWSMGKKEKVIDYNRCDCSLTFSLWHHLVIHKQIDRSYEPKWKKASRRSIRHDEKVVVKLSKTQLGQLLGSKPRFASLARWQNEVKRMKARIEALRMKKLIADDEEGESWTVPMLTKGGYPFVANLYQG